MRITAGVVVLASAGAMGQVQPQAGLYKWEVSADGGASWHSSITVSPGDAYKMRAMASWVDGASPSYGLAGVEFEQVDFINADATDVFGGVSGFGLPEFTYRKIVDPYIWQLEAGTGASAGGLKLESLGPFAVYTILMGQLPPLITPPHRPFERSNPIRLFEMEAVAGDPKVLTVSATWARSGTPPTNRFLVYTAQLAYGYPMKPVEEAVMEDATVHIVPGVGGGAVVVIGAGLAAMRRRRRG